MEKRSKFATFTKIWFLIYIIVTLAFMGVAMYMNVLPEKYILALAGGVLFISLIIMLPMCFRKFRNRTRIPAFILSIVLICGYSIGAYYIANTLDFLEEITTVAKVQTEDYYVVADKNSPYESGEDIKGKEVSLYLTTDSRYIKAKDVLESELKTTFAMEDNLSALADKLIKKETELIFVSKANYDGICEDKEGFKDSTKVIYKVKLEMQTSSAKSVDVTKDPFNVYISGLDVEGTIDITSRSDVNMIVTVNPASHEILLTSIPRDYYVQLPGKGNAYDKLTHTGLYGISETIATAEQLLGIDINYYVKVNYTTVTQLVDAIGGITVDSDYEFSTHGMDVSYYFYEGENYLDGSKALAFARERKSFPDGDFQRNKNQQKVLKGILNQVLNSETILTSYTDILNAIGYYVEINMTTKDMQSLVKMQLDKMPKWNITQQSIKGTGGSDICYSTGDYYSSVVYIDEESVAKAVEGIITTTMGETFDNGENAAADDSAVAE